MAMSTSGSSACASSARPASPTRSFPNARTSSRTRFSRRGSRSRARRFRSGRHRRSGPSFPTTPNATSSASFRRTRRPSSTRGDVSDPRRERARGRALRNHGSCGAQRGGEGHLAPRPRRTAQAGERRERRRVRGAPRPLVRATARRGARAEAFGVPRLLHAAALAARGDLHEGPRCRGLHGTRSRSSASISRTTRGSGSTSTTARRSLRVRA